MSDRNRGSGPFAGGWVTTAAMLPVANRYSGEIPAGAATESTVRTVLTGVTPQMNEHPRCEVEHLSDLRLIVFNPD